MLSLWWGYDDDDHTIVDNANVYDDNYDNGEKDDNDDNDDAPVANNVNWDEGVTFDPLICYM